MSKLKIAIVHPKMGWGGSEATALWMIEALKDNYTVSLVTSGGIDLEGLNVYYQTNLDQKDFSVRQVPMPWLLKKTSKFAALRGRFVQRHCQKIALEFDVMIDAYSPCDFKTRSIQFATDIAPLAEILELSSIKKLWYRQTFIRKLYGGLCDLVSPLNKEAWKQNLTLSNSQWTAGLMLQKYGIESTVLYPPVVGEFAKVPYDKKENGFVMIGRIVPEKKIEMAIAILEKVRQNGHEVTLYIIGGVGNGAYVKKLQPLLRQHASWVFFEGRLAKDAQKNMIAKNKFGISCRANEPFGIAVAEMVKAGCVVFVPEGGGQAEIVLDSNLMYKDINDAARKIEAVITNEALERGLTTVLSGQAQLFSVERFKAEINNIVSAFIKML